MTTVSSHGPAPFRVAILQQNHMAKMFLDAGWWRARAQGINNIEVSAFDNDFLGNVVGFFDRAKITTDASNPVRICHNADVLAAQMQDRFMVILHEQGVAAARAYTVSMHALRLDAQRQVVTAYTALRNHNADIARAATEVATVLSDTILVCEVALAAGVCVLSLGAAPAFVGGASLAAQASAGMAISTLYGVASVAVDHSEENLSAVGIDQTSNVSLNITGRRTDAVAEEQARAILKRSQTVAHSNKMVNQLQKKLAHEISQPGRVAAQRKLVGAINKADNAARDLHASEVARDELKASSRRLPLIQCAVDIIFALQAQHNRMQSLGLGFFGQGAST